MAGESTQANCCRGENRGTGPQKVALEFNFVNPEDDQSGNN